MIGEVPQTHMGDSLHEVLHCFSKRDHNLRNPALSGSLWSIVEGTSSTWRSLGPPLLKGATLNLKLAQQFHNEGFEGGLGFSNFRAHVVSEFWSFGVYQLPLGFSLQPLTKTSRSFVVDWAFFSFTIFPCKCAKRTVFGYPCGAKASNSSGNATASQARCAVPPVPGKP